MKILLETSVFLVTHHSLVRGWVVPLQQDIPIEALLSVFLPGADSLQQPVLSSTQYLCWSHLILGSKRTVSRHLAWEALHSENDCGPTGLYSHSHTYRDGLLAGHIPCPAVFMSSIQELKSFNPLLLRIYGCFQNNLSPWPVFVSLLQEKYNIHTNTAHTYAIHHISDTRIYAIYHPYLIHLPCTYLTS